VEAAPKQFSDGPAGVVTPHPSPAQRFQKQRITGLAAPFMQAVFKAPKAKFDSLEKGRSEYISSRLGAFRPL
jgi:hypothetical protein